MFVSPRLQESTCRSVQLFLVFFIFCEKKPKIKKKLGFYVRSFHSRRRLVKEEVLPPVLGSTAEPPPLFDGTTRLDSNLLHFLALV